VFDVPTPHHQDFPKHGETVLKQCESVKPMLLHRVMSQLQLEPGTLQHLFGVPAEAAPRIGTARISGWKGAFIPCAGLIVIDC